MTMAKHVVLNYAGYTAYVEPTPKTVYGCSHCVLEPGTCNNLCLEAGHHRHVVYYRRYSPIRTLYRALKYKLLKRF